MLANSLLMGPRKTRISKKPLSKNENTSNDIEHDPKHPDKLTRIFPKYKTRSSPSTSTSLLHTNTRNEKEHASLQFNQKPSRRLIVNESEEPEEKSDGANKERTNEDEEEIDEEEIHDFSDKENFQENYQENFEPKVSTGILTILICCAITLSHLLNEDMIVNAQTLLKHTTVSSYQFNPESIAEHKMKIIKYMHSYFMWRHDPGPRSVRALCLRVFPDLGTCDSRPGFQVYKSALDNFKNMRSNLYKATENLADAYMTKHMGYRSSIV
jgi:hypothetical protein